MGIPLLIGGATTSPRHTAIKIAPQYAHEARPAKGATAVPGVAAAVVTEPPRDALNVQNREEQAALREAYKRSGGTPLVSIESARERHRVVEWRAEDIARPEVLGHTKVREVTLGAL